MRDPASGSICMSRIWALALLIVSAALAGCAGYWRPRSTTQATLYSERTEIPVLWADSTFVEAVDGIAVEKGKGFVLVEPGLRSLTIFHVSCPLPIIAVFCLHSASKREIQGEVAAGASYRIGRTSLIEVLPNGQPAGIPTPAATTNIDER